jgi:hypothetical protein
MATTKFTDAYSQPAIVSKAPGARLPRIRPAAIHKATQTESHFSKKPIPAAGSESAMLCIPVAIERMAVQARLRPVRAHAHWREFMCALS